MLQTLKNAWKTVDIRKKLIYTLIILLLYRIGTIIPVPYVNASSFALGGEATILTYLDTLSGGALQQATLFALGISPYITASIVIQLLTVAIPALEKWAQEGEEGKKKINNLTRYTTVILSVITAVGYYFLLDNANVLDDNQFKVLKAFVIVICFCAGASIVMWLGEKINEHGIGNGISIILFANIISALPAKLIRLGKLAFVGYTNGDANTTTWWTHPGFSGTLAVLFAIGYVALLIGMVVFCVYVTGSERRISVQYAKRVVGRKMYGGQSQNLPLKLNMAGVMPVIFASSIISLPATIMAFIPAINKNVDSWSDVFSKNGGFWEGVYYLLRADGWLYPILLVVLIIAFSYFYIQISFNPVEVANNLKKNGGTILGCRPGAPTADFIRKSLSRITLIGAFFLSIVAIVPIILVPLVMEPLANHIVWNSADVIVAWESALGNASSMKAVGDAVATQVSYYTSAFAFGGTSLLIVVGVALELVRDIEAQLSMRSYKGFLN